MYLFFLEIIKADPLKLGDKIKLSKYDSYDMFGLKYEKWILGIFEHFNKKALKKNNMWDTKFEFSMKGWSKDKYLQKLLIISVLAIKIIIQYGKILTITGYNWPKRNGITMALIWQQKHIHTNLYVHTFTHIHTHLHTHTHTHTHTTHTHTQTHIQHLILGLGLPLAWQGNTIVLFCSTENSFWLG